VAAISQIYTAVVKHDGEWWIGWVEEVPGVNAQKQSRELLIISLREVLSETLVMNREEARQAAGAGYEEFAPLLKALATVSKHCLNELPSH
jgi:predicted RNase H-like HicB family nuclease